MKPKDFLHQIRQDEIVAAIQAAERKSSGEIRVFVTRATAADPVAAAAVEFKKLGMEKTRERNGVLIFVAPLTQNFAVVGDKGVHAKCGDAFWQQVSAGMTEHFRAAHFTAGIVLGVKKAGELLAQHFPRRPDDRNELPDRVAHD